MSCPGGALATAAGLLAGQPAAVGCGAGALRAPAVAAAPGDKQLLALHRRRTGQADCPDCARPPGPLLLLAGELLILDGLTENQKSSAYLALESKLARDKRPHCMLRSTPF